MFSTRQQLFRAVGNFIRLLLLEFQQYIRSQLNDVQEKGQIVGKVGGRLDVRGLVCLLSDNTGCHIKMLTRSDLALLECHCQPFTDLTPPPILVSYTYNIILLYLSLPVYFPFHALFLFKT
jgi:hypothetical protein